MSFDKLVTDVALDLFTRRKLGHTGEIAYQNGGGKLFEQFTKNNANYYPYHGEINLLTVNRNAIAAHLKDTEHAIIVGPGPASSFARKECTILEKLPKLKAITLIDLSAEFNRQAQLVLQNSPAANLQNLHIEMHNMDFHDAPHVIQNHGKRAVFLTGGLVTNVSNAPLNGFPDQDMQKELMACNDLAGSNGYVILGYDSNQLHNTLSAAYDQSLAPFIKNIMKIIADHTIGINGFDPDPDNFRYEMQWRKIANQVSHTLIFEKPQHFTITQGSITQNFTFDIGDELVMISSIKPMYQKMTQLGGFSGLSMVNGFFSPHGLVEHIFKSSTKPQFVGPHIPPFPAVPWSPPDKP